MKRISLYILSFLAMTAFVACDEDYKDWAKPQTNEKEDPVSQNVTLTAPAQNLIDLSLAIEYTDVAVISSQALEEGSTVVYEVKVSDDSGNVLELPNTVTDNAVQVLQFDLEDAVWSFYGKEGGLTHAITVTVDAIVTSKRGEAVRISADPIALSAKTQVLPIETGYYVIGDIIDSWDPDDVVAFTSLGNGEFELEITPAAANANFKIIPKSGVDVGGQYFWYSALGSAKDGDSSSAGTLVGKRGVKEAGAIQTKDTETKIIKLNLNNYTYKISTKSKLPENMYMIGAPFGGWEWSDNTNGATMVKVSGIEGMFWALKYFGADQEFKFSPVRAWAGDFGFAGANLPQASIDLAGLSENGGNIKVGTAGWYIVSVTSAVDGTYTVEFQAPEIWLIGDAALGGWDPATNQGDLFTPATTADGVFTSPSITKGGTLRMCVMLPGIEWWRSEFNIIGGKIVHRENGGEQTGIPTVTVGNVVTLNFGNDTGLIQ